MALYMVYVDANKKVANKRINTGNRMITSLDKVKYAHQFFGVNQPPVLWLLADDETEIPDKLREAGFDSEIEFINNYSQVI